MVNVKSVCGVFRFSEKRQYFDIFSCIIDAGQMTVKIRMRDMSISLTVLNLKFADF